MRSGLNECWLSRDDAGLTIGWKEPIERIATWLVRNKIYSKNSLFRCSTSAVGVIQYSNESVEVSVIRRGELS